MWFGLLFILGCQNSFCLEYFRLWKSKVKTSIFFLNLLILADVLSAVTDGYILSVLGPYLSDSKNNDASLLKSMMNSNTEEMLTWLQVSDLFFIDSGFLDSIEMLESLGFRTEMPEYLSIGKKQHTTEEANHSRLVTKVCWVVESANGQIRKWKALDQVKPTVSFPVLATMFALCVQFAMPIAHAL